MGTEHYGIPPIPGAYDPDHPYQSRFRQWAAPGKYLGSITGAALAGKHFLDKDPGLAIPAILAGGVGGSILGGAATGLPGLIHGAFSQRKDRPHEWNEDMSNTMDKLKGQLAVKASSYGAHLRPNQIEEQAYADAFARYKIAAPIGNMLRGAWQGTKALGTHLGTAGGAMKGTFQANKAFSTPMLSNLGQTAQSGMDSLRATGADKTLGRIGRVGGIAGTGYLAGRAMSPSAPQQQQQPPNPYGHVL